jgi:hypothetical protein
VSRRPATLFAVWVAGAAVATGTGVVAVRQVADEVGGAAPAPLTAAGVETELLEATATAGSSAAAAPEATTISPSSSPSPPAPAGPPPATSAGGPVAAAPPAAAPAPPAAVTRSFASRAGSVAVSCAGSGPAQLVYATPSQGWAVDERKQDAERVEVRFRADGQAEVRIRVSCGPDGPVATVEQAGSGSGGED